MMISSPGHLGLELVFMKIAYGLISDLHIDAVGSGVIQVRKQAAELVTLIQQEPA